MNRTAFHRLVAWACPILLFAIGAIKLAAILVERWGTERMDQWTNAQLAVIPFVSVCSLWALTVFLPVCLLWLTVRDGFFRRDFLVLKTTSGTPLKIRQEAVNHYIHDRLIALDFVRWVKVQTWAKKGELGIRVRLRVESHDDDLGNLQERIHARVVNDCKRGFGVAQLRDPDLRFEALRVVSEEADEVDSAVAAEDITENAFEAPAALPPAADTSFSLSEEDEEEEKSSFELTPSEDDEEEAVEETETLAEKEDDEETPKTV